MKKNEMLSCIKKIEMAYRKKFEKEEVELWWEIFANEELETFKMKVMLAVKQCHYMPVIADVNNAQPELMQLD